MKKKCFHLRVHRALPALFLFYFSFSAPSLQAQIEPKAANWHTVVLKAGSQFRLPPPPGAEQTKNEIFKIRAAQKSIHKSALETIAFWDAGDPAYRWRSLELWDDSQPMGAFRATHMLDVAIYDALIAAWDSKYHYNRKRPSLSAPTIKTFVNVLASPSYPCEHAVVAGVASTILAYYYPTQKDTLAKLALQAANSRVLAGVSYPSDVQAGLELGKKVAALYIERAQHDGADKRWDSMVPVKSGGWTGNDPWGIGIPNLKPWFLKSQNEIRPGPPPDYKKEMEELKAFNEKNKTSYLAFEYVTHDHIGDYVQRKLFENHLSQNAPRAARIRALNTMANNDAWIACFDAKYAYWGIRPNQYDTTFQPILGIVPLFPGYPSAHATCYSASFNLMTYLFPQDSLEHKRLIEECSQSRFEGGVHFKIDNTVGEQMGKKIAEKIIAWARLDDEDNKGF